eukprot:248395_1
MSTSPEIIPQPWTKGIDQNGQPYYVNTETGQILRQSPFLNNDSNASTFVDPEQWDLVIETMASAIHPDEQLLVFQKIKKIAEKIITKDDPKYRQLYLNNPKLQRLVLQYDGGIEFLYHLGFQPDPNSRDKLICPIVDARVVQAALICLEDKIEVLSYDIKDSFKPPLDKDPFDIVQKCKHDCNCTKMLKNCIFICDSELMPWKSKNINDESLSADSSTEANKLSQFFKKYYDFNHAKKTISDVSNMMQTNILFEYNHLLKDKSSDLLSKLMQINDAISDAYGKLKDITFTDCLDTEQESDSKINKVNIPLSVEFLLQKIVNYSNKSVIVTSNLQTTISTTILALQQRLNGNKNEYIHILPALRKLKVSKKVVEEDFDCVSVGDNSMLKQIYDERLLVVNEETWREVRSVSLIEGFIRKFFEEKLILPEIINCIVPFYHEYLTSTIHGHGKMQRFKFFCDWVFGKNNDIFDTVICCGHSNWFKQFFNKFMPSDCSWWQKVNSEYLQSCSVIGFKMCSHISSPHHLKRYKIVENSMVTVYKGFEKKNTSYSTRGSFTKFGTYLQ